MDLNAVVNAAVGIGWIASLLAIFFGCWGMLYTEIEAGTTHPGVKKKAGRVATLFILCAIFVIIAVATGITNAVISTHSRA